MAPPNITTALATDADAPAIALVMTSSFGATDAAFALIWGASPGPKWELHDKFLTDALFTPVQKEGRVTFKAVDESGGLLGFSTWTMPNAPVPEVIANGVKEEVKKREPPAMPEGIDSRLFFEKMRGAKEAYVRDVNPEKEMVLSFLFVHPSQQRRGIATQLLEWGKQQADLLKTKCWLASTPQGRSVYEKNGWEVVEFHEVNLSKFGGEGLYKRAWMVRKPSGGA